MSNLNLSTSALSSLIRVANAALPNPDGPEIDPHGPLGPISRLAVMRLGSLSALSAQPSLPRSVWPGVLAQVLIERVSLYQELAQVLPDEASASMQRQIEQVLADFDDDWCPTPPHEPLPRPKRVDEFGLLSLGAALVAARDIHPQLGELGDKFMVTALERLKVVAP